jgi:hypothetical protein
VVYGRRHGGGPRTVAFFTSTPRRVTVMNSEAFELLLFKVAAKMDDSGDDSDDKDNAKDDKPAPKRKGKPAPAEKIVNMDSTGGRVADLLGAATFGGDRAGRSQSMARAAGRDPSFGVKHPATQQLAHMLLGGTLGGVTGGALGSAVGTSAFAQRPGLTPQGAGPSPSARGAAIGGIGGGAAGMLLGALMSTLSRREDMRATNQAYDFARERGTLNPTAPNLSTASAALLPLRGPHRRGQMQGYYMSRGDDAKPMGLGSKTKYIAEHLPYVGLPASLIGGYGQNLATQLESGVAKRQ